jgi:ribosomal protein S18 acetylase RimI-like enzyme
VAVTLRSMRADEFATYRRQMPLGYAAEVARVSGRTVEELLGRCERGIQVLIPDGMLTPGHVFQVAEDDGVAIGHVWFALRESDGRPLVWIYDLEVDEAHRGRGHGRRIMELVEDAARGFGTDRIELNVFAGNEPGLGLYRSLGYVETTRQMAKDL